MANYDFRSLSSFDFQDLVRDLLQEELGCTLECFSPGKDEGIDLRFPVGEEGSGVVQCKHYTGSDFPALLRRVKKEEVTKVRRVKPARYIFVTSLPLTPKRKGELESLFSPFCLSTSDVLGRSDLNNLLARHPGIERKNFKLWLTSEAVLSRVLHAGVWGETALTLDRVRRRVGRYVMNPSLDRARKALEDHHHCIIAGIPGIGKTTLAEVLLLEYVDRRGFEAVRIANGLSEIKVVRDPARKQIFYFDDFLGKTTLDHMEKNEDERLVEFLEDVAANEHWRLLLTTREYILHHATARYESLAHASDSFRLCVIDLADYTRPIRGKILYNHLYFSDLSSAYKIRLLERGGYLRIINHPNYNPRVVEYMTAPPREKEFLPEKFFEAFLESLENPTRVWDHAFRHQISEAGRLLLLAMATLPHEVLEKDLREAYEALCSGARKQSRASMKTTAYKETLKELEGSFVVIGRQGKSSVISFHSQSVRDFLENYLQTCDVEIGDLISDAVFYEQLEILWRGRRGERYEAIADYREEFVEALERTISNRTCRIIRLVEGESDRVIRMIPWNVPYEHRLSFFLEAADSLGVGRALALAGQFLVDLPARVASGASDKAALVGLLARLRSLPRWAAELDTLEILVKGLLTEDLSALEDFESLRRFMRECPAAVAQEEVRTLARRFRSFVSKRIMELVPGGEEYELYSTAEELPRIAEALGVNVEEDVESLRAAIQALESPDPDVEESGDESSPWEAGEDDEDRTDAMFAQYLYELRQEE